MEKIIEKMKKNKALILISIGGIILAGILEFFLSNFDYITIKNRGTQVITPTVDSIVEKKDKKRYYYKITDEKKYIDELEFNIESKEFYISYNFCQMKKGKLKNILEENIDTELDRVVYSLDKEYKDLYLMIETTENDELNIRSIQIINKLQFNLFRFIILSFIALYSFDFFFITKNKKKVDLASVFFKIAISFGILLSIITPMFYSMDEQEHLIRSYYNSRGNFIMNKGEKEKWPVNASWILNAAIRKQNTGYESFKSRYKEVKNRVQDNYVDQYIHSTAINYVFIPYTISGTGIFVARLFGGSIMAQFYLGRIFNLLAYAGIGYWILKKIKGLTFQPLFFFILLLPICLFQAASYSADMFVNIFTFLAIAYTLAIKFKTGKATKRELAVLFSACALTTISKLAYFPIFGLALIIPKEKFENKKENNIYKTSMIIISILLFIAVFLYSSHFGMAQWNIPGADSKEQLIYMITHPFCYVLVLINTVNTYAIEYLRIATSLGYIESIGAIPVIFIWIVLSYLSIINCKHVLSKKDKVILGTIALLCYGATASSLYMTFTPVGSSIVAGLQGRYLIPLFIPLLLLFNRKNGIKVEEKNLNKMLYCSTLIIQVAIAVKILTTFYY